MSNYKCCVVKGCTNTTIKTPGKKFISVPRKENPRKEWLRAARCDVKNYSSKTHLNVCEDHFNFEEDVANYMQHKYYPGSKIVLKPSVVPHIFTCQPDTTSAQPQKEQPSSAKRARKSLVEEIISSTSDPTSQTSCGFGDAKAHFRDNENLMHLSSPENQVLFSAPRNEHQLLVRKSQLRPLPSTPEHYQRSEQVFTSRTKIGVEAVRLRSDQIPLHKDNAVQTEFSGLLMVDKAVTAKSYLRSKHVPCSILENRKTISIATSPISIFVKPVLHTQSPRYSDVELGSLVTSSAILSSWPPETSTKDLTDDSRDVFVGTVKGYKENGANVLQNLNVKLCEQDPMHYLGVSPIYFDKVVNNLAKLLQTQITNILICLRKIRLNIPFEELGYDFEISETWVPKIFEKYVPLMAGCLSGLIYFPDKKTIKERLPINFRARYSNVVSIIDSFEIEIQKPSDPVKQTLTWSHYKKCNTMKYLISITPDGFINFVSEGYGGKTSDLKMMELSGYLDQLPPGVSVMADGGFKEIAKHLEKKHCVLVRPESVEIRKKSSKKEIDLSTGIVRLRGHIERVIRRVREFSFVKPHACVNYNHVRLLDYVVKIVCGLINLQ